MLSPSKKTKKAAAYCRVSTDKEDQANSLESQRRFFVNTSAKTLLGTGGNLC